jgi:hypothetical protein
LPNVIIGATSSEINLPFDGANAIACLEAGIAEATESAPVQRDGRVTAVVVGEQLFQGHATVRCFAPPLRSLREHFNLIGAIYPDPTGTPVADFFEECVAIRTGDFPAAVREVAAAIVAHRPALIWYLGVGMIPEVIALASMRLAPTGRRRARGNLRFHDETQPGRVRHHCPYGGRRQGAYRSSISSLSARLVLSISKYRAWCVPQFRAPPSTGSYRTNAIWSGSRDAIFSSARFRMAA